MTHCKDIRVMVLVILFTTLALKLGCSNKSTNPSPPNTRIQLSLAKTSGAPGTNVEAAIKNLQVSSASAWVQFDSVQTPILGVEGQTFRFYVPIVAAGSFNVVLHDTTGKASDTVQFAVTEAPSTGLPPGQILSDMMTTTNDLTTAVSTVQGRLRVLNIVPAGDSAILAQDLARLGQMMQALQTELASLPDSTKRQIDGFLVEMGLADMFGVTQKSGGLKSHLASLSQVHMASAEFDTFYALIQCDNLSLALSNVKAGLNVAGIVILISTGGAGGVASSVLSGIALSLGIADNVIDGFLPTDLDSVRVRFQPLSGTELRVGDRAQLKVAGYFSSQKSPQSATVESALNVLFAGINIPLMEKLQGAISKIAVQLAEKLGVSVATNLINMPAIRLTHPVPVDIDYYRISFFELLDMIGLGTIYEALVKILDDIGITLPSLSVNPIQFTSGLASYDQNSKQITAVQSGTLNSQSVTVKAWANKPLCSGILSFACFGVEYSKMLPEESKPITSTTILSQQGDNSSPASITNLVATAPTTSTITLTWTAPGDDGNSGTASQYDIRYSTSAITSSNWGSAVQVSGEPTPRSTGSSESFTVTGLSPNTTYYFALKTADEVPNWSSMSNVSSATTGQLADVTPPSSVANLAASGPTSNSMTLTWTAPGDDGGTGTASQYDIRYSTSAITSSNWGSAVQVSGEPTPRSAGSSESFTVTGLSPNTTYYFAIETADEKPNWSGLSNIVSGRTSALSDVTPPAAVLNLAATAPTTSTITLTWIAPGDDGSSGIANQYDVRYSTSTITSSNWSAAAQAVGEPIPKSAGSSESFTVTGLSPNTTYYFAIETADEKPNWSGLSNITSGRTSALSDVTPPAAVSNLAATAPTTSTITLTWTAPGDDGSSGTASQYDIRYSTSTITSSNWSAASQAYGEPTPKSAGSSESFTVTGLSPNTTYYFALKTADEVPNWSIISNNTSGRTATQGATTAYMTISVSPNPLPVGLHTYTMTLTLRETNGVGVNLSKSSMKIYDSSGKVTSSYEGGTEIFNTWFGTTRLPGGGTLSYSETKTYLLQPGWQELTMSGTDDNGHQVSAYIRVEHK